MAGIMAELRQKLSDGKSVEELIGQGYKSGSVFKAQWQLRKRAQEFSQEQGNAASLSSGISIACQRAECQSEGHQAQSEEIERLESGLKAYDELVGTLGDEIDDLNQQVADLNRLAKTNASLNQRVAQFEAQARRSGEAQMSQAISTSLLENRLESEQKRRKESERQVTKNRQEAERLAKENQELRRAMESVVSAGNQLYQEAQALRPLAVWQGHSCPKCSKPMSGVVDREAAARVMKAFAHWDCVKENGEVPVGRLLLAGAAVLLAFSKLK